MWNFIKPIKLIRYLIVWRVTGSLVRLPRWLPSDISLVLGTTIANRLPTQQGLPWRKALAAWDEFGGPAVVGQPKQVLGFPIADPWPVKVVLFPYPGKWTYGQDELILWELKLLGEDADHGFFLEFSLPTMEEVGSQAQWRQQSTVWGRFDVHAIYVARGPRWEPIVRGGHLDLGYRATPTQWAEGLPFEWQSDRVPDTLTWRTPFDLTPGDRVYKRRSAPYKDELPTLRRLLEALQARMSDLLPGKHHAPTDILDALDADERDAFLGALEHAATIPIARTALEPGRYIPGRWTGSVRYPVIPRPLIPYLTLASILHIGRQTHLGCGTFSISAS